MQPWACEMTHHQQPAIGKAEEESHVCFIWNCKNCAVCSRGFAGRSRFRRKLLVAWCRKSSRIGPAFDEHVSPPNGVFEFLQSEIAQKEIAECSGSARHL